MIQSIRIARRLANGGLRPLAFTTRDGEALIARHPADRQWRVFVFDAQGPVGDYPPTRWNLDEPLMVGLIRTAISMGADVTTARDPK
jgi:hypothetical protein